jgi:putative chitinase
MLNRKVFYAEAKVPFFGGRITQQNVDGVEPLLDVWEERYSDQPLEFLAYILAGVFRETGGKMTPQRETFADSEKEAVRRLDVAWAKGKMPWVKTPYWRSKPPYIGHGRIQNTHAANYAKLAKRFNVPELATNPSMLLDPKHNKLDAEITVVGHMEGIWTGKKLADFWHPEGVPGKPGEKFDARGARRIVNALDHADEIAANYKIVFKALKKAAEIPIDVPVIIPDQPDQPPVPASPAEVFTENTTAPVGEGRTPVQSQINWAAILTAVTGALGTLGAFFEKITTWPAVAVVLGLLFAGVVVVVILRERIRYLAGV